jgi:hypothetical protein
LKRGDDAVARFHAAVEGYLRYWARSWAGVWCSWANRSGAGWWKKLYDIENKFVEVARDQLVNFVQDEEPYFRTGKSTGGGEEGMELLRSAADDVGHVLL